MPLAARFAGDRDVSFDASGLINAVRAGAIRAMPGCLRDAAIYRVVEDQRLNKVDRGFYLTKIEVLPDSRPVAFEDRCGEGGDSVPRRDEVCIGAPCADRRAVWPAR
ncbi:MAG: hypothetical protein ABIP13_03570 [Tepidiformaceae bacterium]